MAKWLNIKIVKLKSKVLKRMFTHKLEEYPNCQSGKETGKVIIKDVKDYYIVTVNTRL